MTETVTLTIDGTQVTVPKGTTIIQAADTLGTEIPRFCYHPGLSVAGVCRFCMVKVEGMPKLQISCNTTCTEGMKVTTKDTEVKDAHKWALEFHLINHPLDCPICDQAGECELQNSYMKVGKYVSQMKEDKVLKPKALDVGNNLVLDTERCILCSRCVRFENEVTKTEALGIFNRGDRSVIGTFPGKRINHNYSYNLVDVCPVGAFTAKDFRFKCRVWFLRELKSVCPGCSTGCNVSVFYKKRQKEYYRLKPRYNAEVNGHWMCDYGRTMYHHLNATERFELPLKNGAPIIWTQFLNQFSQILKNVHTQEKTLRVILTPQYTNEEYETLFSTLNQIFDIKNVEILVWRDREENREHFDNILFRGDKNPNTKGLENALDKWQILAKKFHKAKLANLTDENTFTLIFAPEVQTSYKSFAEDIKFIPFKNTICFTVNHFDGHNNFAYTVPVRAFTEKTGTYTNFQGITQKLEANPPVFAGLMSIDDIFNNVSVT